MNNAPEHGKLPPQAPDLEQAVLGACMLEAGHCMPEVADLLRPEAFYVIAHGIIWTCLADMYGRGDAIDILTVTHELKQRGQLEQAGGAYYIATLTNRVASSANVQYHTLIVLQQFLARETIRVASEASRKAYEGEDALELIPSLVEELEASIAKAIKRRGVRYADAEAAALERLNSDHIKPITTGFDGLDNILGGWHRGNLVIIAARPAMGKSSMAISSACATAEAGRGVLVMSMELTEAQGQARIFSRRSGVPLETIVNGKMTPAQIAMRHADLAKVAALPLWIRYDTALDLSAIRSEITRMKKQNGVNVVFIDQLNWIEAPKAQNRDTAIGLVTRGLKLMALQLDVCIILLHQLSRDVERRGGDKVPQLSDLRDSGNVEQDAQVVLFPHRPEYYGIMEDAFGSTIGVVHLIAAKNSNGPLGTARMRFENSTASIAPFEQRTRDDFQHPDNRHDPSADQAPF